MGFWWGSKHFQGVLGDTGCFVMLLFACSIELYYGFWTPLGEGAKAPSFLCPFPRCFAIIEGRMTFSKILLVLFGDGQVVVSVGFQWGCFQWFVFGVFIERATDYDIGV